MKFSTISSLAAISPAFVSLSSAITISNTPTRDELIDASNQVKANMLTFYNGDQPGGIPGYMLNPDFYFWWLTGGMLGHLINHWALTGNDTYNKLINDAVVFQSQDNDYFMPRNQTTSEGNDDQAFWAFASLDAAETNFPPPTKDGLSWLGLAQGVWTSQMKRWRADICDGGLEWQINPANKGANFKNTPTNAGFFMISARLYRYTGNSTYLEWAEKTYDWLEKMTLIEEDKGNPGTYQVWDGVPDGTCASARSDKRYTYNAGMLIMGGAYLSDKTKDPKWKDRMLKTVKGMSTVFLVKEGETDLNNAIGGKILAETNCEYQNGCNADQTSFRSYVIRWLTVATQLVPDIQDETQPILQAALQGVAKQCTGKAPGQNKTPPAARSRATPGSGNNWCGQHWYLDTWDEFSGLGEQMSAFSVFQNNIVFLNGGPKANAISKMPHGDVGQGGNPLSQDNGGTSKSNPNAGSGADDNALVDPHWKAINGGDKFGAAVLTILGVVIPVVGVYFMVIGD